MGSHHGAVVADSTLSASIPPLSSRAEPLPSRAASTDPLLHTSDQLPPSLPQRDAATEDTAKWNAIFEDPSMLTNKELKACQRQQRAVLARSQGHDGTKPISLGEGALVSDPLLSASAVCDGPEHSLITYVGSWPVAGPSPIAAAGNMLEG